MKTKSMHWQIMNHEL